MLQVSSGTLTTFSTVFSKHSGSPSTILHLSSAHICLSSWLHWVTGSPPLTPSSPTKEGQYISSLTLILVPYFSMWRPTKYRCIADSFIEIFADYCRRFCAGMCCIRPIARFRSTITMRWRTITLVWGSCIATTIDWQLEWSMIVMKSFEVSSLLTDSW